MKMAEQNLFNFLPIYTILDSSLYITCVFISVGLEIWLLWQLKVSIDLKREK